MRQEDGKCRRHAAMVTGSRSRTSRATRAPSGPSTMACYCSAAMPVTTRARVLGCPVDVVDMGAAVQRLVELCEAPASGRPAVVVTLNPEILMRARREPDFEALLEFGGAGRARRDRRWCARCAGAAIRRRCASAAPICSRRTFHMRDASVTASRSSAPARVWRSAPPRVLRARLPGRGPGRRRRRPHRGHRRRVGEPAPAAGGRRLRRGAPGAVPARPPRDHARARRHRRRWHARLPRRHSAARARRPCVAPGSSGCGGWLREPSRWRRQLVLPQFWWLERREVAAVISVVVPAFNERERIPATLERLREYLDAAGEEYEVIVADDGSTDDTVAFVEVAAERLAAALGDRPRPQPGQGRGGARRHAARSRRAPPVHRRRPQHAHRGAAPTARAAGRRLPGGHRVARRPRARRSTCTSRAAGR